MDLLPSRLAADRLINHYFLAVHPIAQIVHRPSFQKEYEEFWGQISLGIEPPKSVQAIIFAAMFSGAVSMDEGIILRDFGISKQSLQDNFKVATESTLGRANFLRTTKIETLQAFVMYLVGSNTLLEGYRNLANLSQDTSLQRRSISCTFGTSWCSNPHG